MKESFYETEDTIKTLKKIKNSNTGTPINAISIAYIVMAVLSLILFLVLTFSIDKEERSVLAPIFIGMGISIAITFYLISVVLKMFYETHFVITHLTDIIHSNNIIAKDIEFEKFKATDDNDPDKLYMTCKVCGKRIEVNDYGTCEECHQDILKRLENK